MIDLRTVAAAVVMAPGALAALHLGVVALASIGYREPRPTHTTRLKFLALVPAHDEELVVADAVVALVAAARPGDIVAVVADRCTDDTARVARAAGAVVFARAGDRPPGRAAAIEDGIREAAHLDWEVVVTIDADSVVAPGYFEACERSFSTGALAVQTRSEAALGHGPLAHVALAARSLQAVLLPRGRDRLGVGVRLYGSGMALRRELLTRYRFRSPGASEDLWFSMDLCLDGVHACFADSARLRSANPPSLGAASTQRLRWETGRMFAAREYVPRLLQRHDAACLEAAAFLLSPPFALAVLSTTAGLGISLAAGAPVLAIVAGVALATLGMALVLALAQSRVPATTWFVLAGAPVYVAWKAALQLWALARLRVGNLPYTPTPRR